MTLEIFWKLAEAGIDRRRGEWGADARPWAPAADARSRDRQINHYDYLAQIARAAELTGFDGLLIPDDPDGEEPWIVTSALVRETRRLKIATAVVPGSASAVYHAKMAASVERFSGGRQIWAIDLTRDAAVRAREGDFAIKADLLPRAEELVTLARGIWGDGPHDQEGRFFLVEKGALGSLAAHWSFPELWTLGGNVDAATLGDVHFPAQGTAGGASVTILARETQADVDPELARLSLPADAVIGTYDDVAQQLAVLVGTGVTRLVLNAGDQIREVHIAGEQILPRLRQLLSGADRAAA